MASLDIFEGDAFSLTNLTLAINDVPHQPGRIGQLGWFDEEGITTLSVMIERQGSKIELVPAIPRGAPATPKGGDKRRMVSIPAVHLPQRSTIMADVVQSVRAFGKETETEAVMTQVTKRLRKMRRDLDTTIEYQRVGAIKGQVLDADGVNVLYDMFDIFGLTPLTSTLKLSVASTKVRSSCVAFKRKIEAALGGLQYRGLRALCSADFFDDFVDHEAVVRAWDNYQNNQKLQEDLREGFKFAGIIWEEYVGSVASIPFIEPGTAYLIPEGVGDMFVTNYAPADYMETVNTNGLPYYAKQQLLDYNKGIEIETQSNPIQICTRPDAILKITKN